LFQSSSLLFVALRRVLSEQFKELGSFIS
jgi:hypothetical protein